MAAKEKVPVSMRALIQRINRKLRHNGELLKVARGSRGEAEADVGRYFIVNIKRDLLVNDHCDPEEELADWCGPNRSAGGGPPV